MSTFPSMPMWWADFFSKTDHLSNAEQWAYAKLLAKTWMRNARPFPDDDRDIARALNLSQRQWAKIKPRIAPFFDLSDGTWRQQRLESEHLFVAERAQKSRSNGMRGGRPPRNNIKEIENPSGSISITQTITRNEPTHLHIEEEARKGSVDSYESTGAEAPILPVVEEPKRRPPPPDPKKELYARGKVVLGKSAGGQITKLIRVHDGDLEAAMYTLEKAAKAAFPAEYIGKILSGESRAPINWDLEYEKMGMRPDGSSIGYEKIIPLADRPGDDGGGWTYNPPDPNLFVYDS